MALPVTICTNNLCTLVRILALSIGTRQRRYTQRCTQAHPRTLLHTLTMTHHWHPATTFYPKVHTSTPTHSLAYSCNDSPLAPGNDVPHHNVAAVLCDG